MAPPDSSEMQPAPKRRRGRPVYVPNEKDRNLVRVMLNYRDHETIAGVLGIDDKTLRKHYREEIRTAKETANANVAASIYSKATAKDCTSASVQAAIFWARTRMGWKEPRDAPSPADIAEMVAVAQEMFRAGMNEERGGHGYNGHAVPNGTNGAAAEDGPNGADPALD